MFNEPPLSATSQLHDVLAGTLSIVEAEYPQIDTAFVHYGLDQTPGAYKLT